jgi:hypothetical protein
MLCAPSISWNPKVHSPISGGRSVGIVRSRTQATEFVVCCLLFCLMLSTPAEVQWSECNAYVFKGEELTKQPEISRQNAEQFLPVAWACSSSVLKIEAVRSSETAVGFCRPTRCHIPQSDKLQSDRCENIKSNKPSDNVTIQWLLFADYEYFRKTWVNRELISAHT